MKDHQEQMIRSLVQIYGQLPKKLQGAIGWAVENHALLRERCKDNSFSEEEYKRFSQQAIDSGDIMLLMLLYVNRDFERRNSDPTN